MPDVGARDAQTVADSVTHLETEGHDSVTTRDIRLGPIRSFPSVVALRHHEHIETIGHFLEITPERFERNLVAHLAVNELEVLLGAWYAKR